jgi:hypothetical protein
VLDGVQGGRFITAVLDEVKAAIRVYKGAV